MSSLRTRQDHSAYWHTPSAVVNVVHTPQMAYLTLIEQPSTFVQRHKVLGRPRNARNILDKGFLMTSGIWPLCRTAHQIYDVLPLPNVLSYPHAMKIICPVTNTLAWIALLAIPLDGTSSLTPSKTASTPIGSNLDPWIETERNRAFKQWNRLSIATTDRNLIEGGVLGLRTE
jgi:hypothetical protein